MFGSLVRPAQRMIPGGDTSVSIKFLPTKQNFGGSN